MDIDHLYLMSYNYKKGEDGKLTNKFDSQTEAKKYHLNMIMDCMMTLLKDTENSTHSLYKSIDNDTDLAKDVADKIPVFGSNKHKAFNFGALTEQVERKNDYITGKKGIGPFALNVTNLILTYLYNVQFKDTKFCKETGIWKLDHLEDWDDNSIQSWLGAFINGHVDIVKDPWVSKLNVNPFTYNMLNLLLRSGFGEVALWFLSQPIIKNMAAASDNAQSQFLRDPHKDGSVWKAREKAILEVVKMYVPESKLTPEYINKFLNEKDPTRRINAVNFLKENVSQLERIATGKEIPGELDVQEMVFFAWKALEKYAAALGAMVQHSKIDTRKHGKSLIEIANYMDGYNKIFHPEGADRQSSLWDLDSLDHFARHSWLEQKTKAAISWPFKILHGLTFNGNESFMRMCISICRTLVGKNGTISTDLLQLISRHMQTKIKSKYFLDYARNYLQMSDEDITGLFVGDFTIAKRLNNLKYAIQHFEQYNRLANNRLLNQIMPVNLSEPITVTNENKKQDTIERPQFITVLDNVDSSRINSDDLIDGWVDLLNDSDKNVKKFARDLIVYAFLTSGEFKGWNKLFKYVPQQWLRGQIDADFKPYSKFIKEELLSTFASSEDDIDEIVSNNDTDFKIVKTMKDEDEDGNKNFVAKTHLVLIGRQRTKKEDIDELPVYISVDNPMESNRNRNGKNLFKLVDMYHGYPIYMRMRHKGYHYGNTDIYEYGWTFEYLENGLRQSRLTDYQSMYEKAQRYIDSLDNHAVDEFEQNPEEVAGAIIKAALYSEDNTVEADQVLTPQEIAEQENAPKYTWSRYAEGKPNYEVSSKGDPRFSAMNATFAPGTIFFGHDVSGRTIESVYQHGVKQGDWVTDNNSKTGRPNSKVIIKGNDEDASYEQGYLPLWRLWASQNPELMEELAEKVEGKVLTDMFASTRVSQARALSDLLNDQLSYESYDIENEYLEDSGVSGLFESVDNPATHILTPETKINIYAGTGENADLSNFAVRPIDVSEGEISEILHRYVGKAFKAKFKTVEGAFQAMKIFFSSEDYTDLYIPQGGLPTIGITKKGDQMLTKFENASGSQARSLGRQIQGFDKDKWDKVSSVIMKALIKASFEQNPQALQRLLATGNATLTHTQDKGKWGTEFPKLLMEVRDELRKANETSAPAIINESYNTKEHEQC